MPISIQADEKLIVSSVGAISLTEVPRKFVAIGAGCVGLELVIKPRTLRFQLALLERDSLLGICVVEIWLKSNSDR